MGMDIYSNSGVVLPVSEVSGTLFGGIQDVSKIVKALEKSWKDEWGKIELENVKSGEELAAWFTSLADSLVRDDYLDDSVLTEVWDVITKKSGLAKKLPHASFDYWTHSRISGWEVPTEVPCVIFHEDGLFETKPTREGRKLSKLLGQEIQLTTWTVMSV